MGENRSMTSIYLIRHAQPNHDWEDDRTRPLTVGALEDNKKVTEVLRNIKIDYYVSSPYKRSVDTIIESSIEHMVEIVMEERFRERERGIDGNNLEMFKRRWDDFNFHEDGGESLNMVQKRNIDALLEILNNHKDENVVIGTHGTALSTILNYFEPSYCCNDFLRIIDFMPYIIRLDFDGIKYIGQEELLIIEKEFKGGNK